MNCRLLLGLFTVSHQWWHQGIVQVSMYRESHTMKYVNRCVVTLKPRDAFIQWVKKLDAEQPVDWTFEGGSYLLDEESSEEAIIESINIQAEAILTNELSVWTEDRSLWPKDRGCNQLSCFFEYYISVVGFDLGRASLLRADMTSDDVMFT